MRVDGEDYGTVRCKVRTSTSCASSNPTLILDQVLARDGFRCVLTGMFDMETLTENSELDRVAEDLPDFPVSTVIACHILNGSTTQGVDPSGDGEGGSVVNKVWAIGLPIPFYNLDLLSRQIMLPMLLAFLIALDSGTSSKHSFGEMVPTILEI